MYPYCKIVLDLRFLAFHDQIQLLYQSDWLWQSLCVGHFHLNDYSGQPYSIQNMNQGLHPGEGEINYQMLFGFLKKVRFDGTFTLETPSLTKYGVIETERLNMSIRFIKDLIKDCY